MRHKFSHSHFRGDSTGYTRFIILGTPRCGSNWLTTLLRSNETIVAHPELFVEPGSEIHWGYPGYPEPADPEVLGFRDEHPLELLETLIFRPYAQTVKAVGFKLFYKQARHEGWRAVWPHLREGRVRVIHLKRVDKLSTAVSFVLATATNEWVRFRTDAPDDAVRHERRITLDPSWLERFFAEISLLERQMDAYFAGNLLQVRYEDLYSAPDVETARIQEYLGVAARKLDSPLEKQNRLSPRSRVSNFAELARHFRGTRWSAFFEQN